MILTALSTVKGTKLPSVMTTHLWHDQYEQQTGDGNHPGGDNVMISIHTFSSRSILAIHIQLHYHPPSLKAKREVVGLFLVIDERVL